MVKIRLKRQGFKFNPRYRVVVVDAKAPRDGKTIEKIGHYNPISKDIKLNKELVFKWLKNGAQPTNIVKKLLQKTKIWQEFFELKKSKKTNNEN